MATSGERGASKDPIHQLMSLLAEEQLLFNEQKLTSIEIAETLWLALKIEPAAKVVADEPQISGREDPASPPTPIAKNLASSEALDPGLPPPPPPPKAAIATVPPKVSVLPSKALPVWITDPAMLSDPLAIIRALKPLLKSVESGGGRQLDESATVEQTARTRLCLPVLLPEKEPWFDIVLVVDRGSSMQIWQRLVTDLVGILKRYGAFRDVQTFNLEVDREAVKEKVLLRTHSERPGHRPSELIDQSRRRIAIVLSDCAGSYWWDGTLLPMLQSWSSVMPTVVWQMLPEWMWQRTALGRGNPVALSNDRPGAANQQLITRVLSREEPEDIARRVSVPIVTSEVRDLRNWSLMLAGDPREVTPGILLPQQGRAVPKSKSIGEIAQDRVDPNLEDQNAAIAAEIEAIARQRVERFRSLSSPHARRLVMLLAAAPVITLPVMRLIRDSMLYEARSPLPIAEVFLSGLLQPLSEQEGIESDLVQYDFVPKAREVLLKVLPEVDTIEVINSVSAAVEKQWNKFAQQDFRAFLLDPKIEEPEGLEGLRSFASVTADILEQLGSEYASFARQLRHGMAPTPDPPAPEDVSFPELELFEFVDVKLVDEAEPEPFPPPLKTEEFTVIKVLEQTPESFEFVVATLRRSQQKNQWEIQRQPGRASRFIERLPGEIALEMVEIPGGTFLMGSPKKIQWESPQHEVTIAAFSMGRYPVTQAQWQAVAALSPIQRHLTSDPSYFKGDQRPVEQISWYDAVEFCARLSALTNREYRLPSEAEWEYACRAGTTTDFHFGDAIVPQVANYRVATGRSLRETTSVGSFGCANAFGLSDMHGNVREWCEDHLHRNYEDAPRDGRAWLTVPEVAGRMTRGGSCVLDSYRCRSAHRHSFLANLRFYGIGFRVVCSSFTNL